MVVETYSDKEVAVGTCEMAPEMFQEAIKITKEAIALPTNADAAKKIKSSFDEKYGDNWMEMSLMKRPFEMLKYNFLCFNQYMYTVSH